MYSWYIFILPLTIVSIVFVINHYLSNNENEFDPRYCISEAGNLETDVYSDKHGLMSITTWVGGFIIEKTVIVRSYCNKLPRGSRAVIVAYDDKDKVFLIEPYV